MTHMFHSPNLKLEEMVGMKAKPKVTIKKVKKIAKAESKAEMKKHVKKMHNKKNKEGYYA